MKTGSTRAAAWLVRGACAALGASILGLALGDPHSGGAAPVRAIAEGVYLRPGVHEAWGPANRAPVANGGFVVGQRCVAVIDPGGSAAEGRALKAAVRRVTPLPVCHVVNTHVHPDHLLGNAAFDEAQAGQDKPQFVGHHRLAAALAARGPYHLKALAGSRAAADGTRLVPPTLEVRDTLTLDLGGRRLLLRAWPTAHTDTDLTVLDEASGTLWLGDLLFHGHLPVLDGNLAGWLAAIGQLRALPGVRLAVPGHGAPSTDWPGALEPQARYLARLREDTRAALRQRLPIEQAVERVAPEADGRWQLVEEFHRRNVTAAYAELEWEE